MISEVIDKFDELFQGKIPEKIANENPGDEQEQALAGKVNQLIDFMQEIQAFIVPLSQGELSGIKMQSKNFLASPFKELHSRLLHLTWQANQVAKGDYSQRVDFMGDFSEAFNTMIKALEQNDLLLKEKINELEKALAHIINLEGILPICSNCKKIRLEGADPKIQGKIGRAHV
jgi:sigma-B regulation protein RsbU (phosphoserine phosphatase)